MPKATKRRPAPKPFHPVSRHVNAVFTGYSIYVNNVPWLASTDAGMPLKRHDAYAICRLLNGASSSRKWAERFADPYVEVT